MSYKTKHLENRLYACCSHIHGFEKLKNIYTSTNECVEQMLGATNSQSAR
jgi:hypothetical protein